VVRLPIEKKVYHDSEMDNKTDNGLWIKEGKIDFNKGGDQTGIANIYSSSSSVL
jgi:hypothetical protein